MPIVSVGLEPNDHGRAQKVGITAENRYSIRKSGRTGSSAVCSAAAVEPEADRRIPDSEKLILRRPLQLLLGLACSSCSGMAAHPPTPSPQVSGTALERPEELASGTGEAFSLLGQVLVSPTLPQEVKQERSAKMMEAKAAYDAEPTSEDAAVWYGRRLAYLGRYQDAIEIYSEALQIHPDSPRLLRHRGHRYITVRKMAEAVGDLQRAALLIEGKPDVIEQDGLPNEAGVPTGTLRTNITYHLGLAHFLVGDFAEAEAVYKACVEASTTDDMRVAATHWLYMTLRRLDQEDAAAEVLEPIRADGMTIYENHAYHQLLLLYKGELSVAELQDPSADAIKVASTGFGVGHFLMMDGNVAGATSTFEGIVATEQWAAFGYIAAEAELARQRNAPSD